MILHKTHSYKSFPPELWNNLKSKIEGAVASRKGPLFAAFDADGTLWPLDAGESFFRYQIAEGIPHRPTGMIGDPWNHYVEMKKTDVAASCLLLAQINKGISLSSVRKKALACQQSLVDFPVHESQKKLISYLHSCGVEVFVVTASIKWAVEPFAALLGIDSDHVLGIEVKEENGILTDQGVFPLSLDSGKAKVLLSRTGGVRPILAAGNTTHDSHLIETATHVPLAVSSAKPGEVNEATEARLAAIAKEKNWYYHSFA